MAVYPANLAKLIGSPKFAGRCDQANGVGSDANFACGSVVRFFISVDDEVGAVAEVGYETNGCGYMVAAAEVIAGHVSNKRLGELHGLNLEAFKSFPDELLDGAEGKRGDCLNAAINAIKAAFSDHRSRVLEEFAGEKALICSCFGVSEETIERYVVENRPNGAAQVAEAIRAGSGCGSCRMLIQEIIDSSRR